MSKLDSLKESLDSLLKKNSPYQSGSSLVPKLEYKELADRLKPVQLGKSRGEKNLPLKDSSITDDVELKIQNTFQEMIDKTAQDVNTTLISYNERLHNIDITRYMDEIKDAARSTVSDFRASMTNGLNELKNGRESVKEKYSDLGYFKEEHNIRRSAHYPTTAGLWAKITLLVILFLVESVGNAAFLSVGNMGGLVGAYAEAIFISVLNVGTALLVGRFVTPYLYHKSMLLTLIASLVLIITLLASGVLNLAVAHYRELSGAGFFGESGFLAIERLIEIPFDLQSIQSWILFVVGWLFWVVAVIDMHTMDDNYPGYGRVSKSVRDARDDYADLKAIIIDDITDLRKDGEEDIKELRYQLSELYSQTSSIQALKRSLLKDYEIFSDQSTRFFAQIIESYRNTNLSHREDIPACFSKNIELTLPRLRDDSEPLNLRSLSNRIGKGKKELDAALNSFYEEFGKAVDAFKKLDELEESPPIEKVDAESVAKEGKSD